MIRRTIMRKGFCLFVCLLLLFGAALPSFGMDGYPYSAYPSAGGMEGYGYGAMAGYGYGTVPTYPATGYEAAPAYPATPYGTTGSYPAVGYGTAGSYPATGYGTTGSYPATAYGAAGVPAYPAAAAGATGLPLKYTITYLPGKYSSGPSMTVEWSPGYAILAGQIYTRAGFTQTGWSWSDGGAKAFELNQQVPITTNAVLYPYWESITKALYLTVNYAGNGAVRLSGGNVPNGWTGKLEPGQSYTFQLVPYDQHYVYSIFLAGWYRNVQPGNTFMVTYEMLQGQNQTIYFRFESVYRSPKTGDDSNLPLWAALGGLSLVGLAAILFMRRKK